MPVFPILRPNVHILRKFLKILGRHASACRQLLEVLPKTKILFRKPKKNSKNPKSLEHKSPVHWKAGFPQWPTPTHTQTTDGLLQLRDWIGQVGRFRENPGVKPLTNPGHNKKKVSALLNKKISKSCAGKIGDFSWLNCHPYFLSLSNFFLIVYIIK